MFTISGEARHEFSQAVLVFVDSTRLTAVIAAAFLAGCHLVLDMPAYDPSRLKSIRTIELAVGVEARETFMAGNASKPEWAAQARTNLTASIVSAFSTDGYVIKMSEAVPAVPWYTNGNYPDVYPKFTIPNCELAVPHAESLLEVVAFQLVKSTGSRVDMFIAGLVDAPLLMPFAPTDVFGLFFGEGRTAVRFCLFEAGTSRVAWVYADWFHGGLDLRDRANVDKLVRKAHEAFRQVAQR